MNINGLELIGVFFIWTLRSSAGPICFPRYSHYTKNDSLSSRLDFTGAIQTDVKILRPVLISFLLADLHPAWHVDALRFVQHIPLNHINLNRIQVLRFPDWTAFAFSRKMEYLEL
jgi:hypothetical protein